MLRARLRGALAGRVAPAPPKGFTRASVLVPLIGDGEARLLFIERAAHEKDPHSGQIGFPGGRSEPDDADAAATALRECEEELGLSRDQVEVLGPLEGTLTPSGYAITPIVGWLERSPSPRPDPREVACCFEVPLRELADPGCRHERGVRRIDGKRFEVFEYRAGGRVIWGATARIVECLLAVSAERAAERERGAPSRTPGPGSPRWPGSASRSRPRSPRPPKPS